MTDIVLVPVTGGNNISAMNNNFDKIEDSINNDILHLEGGNNVMKQDIDMNSNSILNYQTDVNDPDSLLSVGDADSRYYNITGDTLQGDMNAGGNQIFNLPAAASGTEPVRKQEFDAANAAQDSVTAANNAKTIRTPENIPALGNIASRANKLLSFDGSGNPVTVAAVDQSATALEIRLADQIDPANGSAMIGYLDEGTGAVGTTVDEKLQRVVYVKDYMSMAERADALLATPLLDHTLAWRKAVAACDEGGTVFGEPEHTYTINWQASDGFCVLIEKGITIDMRNAKVRYKPYNPALPASTHSPAFFFRGGTGTARTINPVSGRPQNVTCSTAAQAGDFATGDLVFITSDETRLPWNFPEGVLSGFTGQGEIQLVLASNAGTGVVTLTRPLENDYAATASITKLTTLKRPKLLNISSAFEIDSGVVSTKPLSENVGHFASFYVCDRPETNAITASGFRLFVNMFWLCWQPYAKGIKGYLPPALYPPQGGHAYVMRHHLCYGALSTHNEGLSVRHLIDYTSSHECTQHDNICHNPIAGAYVAHGFGERRLTSIDDASHGGTSGGWNYGNEVFRGAFEGRIERFEYTGGGTAINVTTLSDDVLIKEPDVRLIGGILGAAVRISSGASNVRIKGGLLDKSAATVSGGVVELFPSFANANAVPGTLLSATATAGTNVVVTVVNSVAHGLLVNDQIYLGIRIAASPDSEYAGYWTVTAVSTTTVPNDTFQFVRTGTTVNNLSYVGVNQQIWKAANYKPVTSVKLSGVRLVPPPVAGSLALSGSCRGELEVDDCTIAMGASGSGLFLDSRYSDQAPQTIKLTRNLFTGSHTRGLDSNGEYASKSLTISGNTSTEYTNAFLNVTGASDAEKRARYVTGRNFVLTENNVSAAAPTNGLANIDLWNFVGLGADVFGNKYPANAAVTNSFNKNWEYGTFTPTIRGGTTAGTAIYVNQVGHYQLDGRSLNVRCRLNFNTFTGTGQMQITPMPYDASSFPVPCMNGDTTITFTGSQLAFRWSGTQVHLRQIASGGTTDIAVNAAADVLFTSRLHLTTAF